VPNRDSGCVYTTPIASKLTPTVAQHRTSQSRRYRRSLESVGIIVGVSLLAIAAGSPPTRLAIRPMIRSSTSRPFPPALTGVESALFIASHPRRVYELRLGVR